MDRLVFSLDKVTIVRNAANFLHYVCQRPNTVLCHVGNEQSLCEVCNPRLQTSRPPEHSSSQSPPQNAATLTLCLYSCSNSASGLQLAPISATLRQRRARRISVCAHEGIVRVYTHACVRIVVSCTPVNMFAISERQQRAKV